MNEEVGFVVDLAYILGRAPREAGGVSWLDGESSNPTHIHGIG